MYNSYIKKGSIILLPLLFMALSGCLPKMMKEFEKTTLMDQIVKPRPWGMATTPEGPPLYQKGWNEGCDSGLAAYGNGRYKVSYTFTQDWRLVENKHYYSGWKQGYGYCRWYAYNWVRPWRE